MSSCRIWLFRGFVAITAGLMIASFIMPWHTIEIAGPGINPPPIKIYGYGLRHRLAELRQYVQEDETPLYQTVLAWVYLGASVGLMLYSTWLKGRKGKWLLGGIGLIYIAYTAIAVFVVIANRIADFGITLQGWSSRLYSNAVEVPVSHFASLEIGYYLAYVAGGMCIVLTLIRNLIIGKLKLSA